MKLTAPLVRWLAAGALVVAVPLGYVAATTGGSPVQAAAPPPFTLVVLPDTQSYTVDATFAPIMGQQTRWIRDQRTALNTAFVAQVGDLVESHPSEPMWQRASEHMQVLDDAGVPSAVLPGNHDMDVSTGEAAMYDRYFPASRYEQNTWTPSTTTYGGHSPDRGNKDSFSLFSAGGMDFLVLSLEYETPDDALAWAQGVIDQHPDRRVIVSTHGFVDTDDQRGSFTTRTDPGTNSAPEVWDELVTKNCNVFLVVSGHWTSRQDGTQGEGRRTDLNACGRPVHQVLSNYQGRPNGGDGWLRYYTFDPAANTIAARTYSPYLERFETDADSQFTLDYPMSTPADDLTTLHSGAGAAWRYRFEPTDPPADWTSTGFDASGWATGYGSFGFGTYGPSTDIDVPAGQTRPLAAQLRREVELTDASRLQDPRLTVWADDGVVVHVNGTEVGRSNLPAGAVSSDTYAIVARSHADAVAEPSTFAIPAGLLRDGTNTITAQVVSNYRATPDLTFEATLSSTTR